MSRRPRETAKRPSASKANAAEPEILAPKAAADEETDEDGEPNEDEDEVIDADALELGDDDSGDSEGDSTSGDGSGYQPLVPALPSTDEKGVERADALTRYMAQLRHHAPITREQEHELAVRWTEHGDVEAARQMVLSNLRLVVKIAFEYRRAWAQTLDLIQEGNVGLMEAVQRYDPYKGVKLSSYAVYWIRAYILKYILDHMRSVRLGTTRAQRKLFFRLNKEKRELERQGYEAEPRLIAERLDVSEKDVVEMEASLSRPDLSFDAPVHDDEGSATYGDFMSGGGASAEEQVGSGELARLFRDQIQVFRESLEERDEQILEERILAEDPRTLADMGEEFGVSRERVRQLEARLVKRLREHMKEALVDFEYYAPESAE